MSELDKLLQQMEEAEASELYLQVGQQPKFRIHGDMAPVEDAPAMDQRMLGRYLMELVNETQREAFFKARDFYFVYSIEGKFRFRCNFFFQQTGYAAVFRPIPNRVPTFDRLGLPPVLEKLAELAGGTVLVAGPPGCGKTTTMAAIVNTINENLRQHVIIIEKPIEFLHKNKKSMIVHREVGLDTESFNKAVQAIARQDVDVALLSEFRDPEMIFDALKAANRGTLVYGAVYAGSAVEAIDAVIDAFPPDRQPLARDMLAESLQAVVVQDLVPVIGGKQRVPACEILLQSDGLAEAVRKGDSESILSLIRSGRDSGMQTMDDALAELVKEDVIDEASARKRARDKERFAKRAGGDRA